MTLMMNYSSSALDSELVWHLGKLLFVSPTRLSSGLLGQAIYFSVPQFCPLEDLPIAHVSLSSHRKVGHCIRNITQICNSLEEANITFFFFSSRYKISRVQYFRR